MLDSPKQNDPSRPSPTPTSPGNPNTWDDLNDRSVPPGDIKPPSPEPGETEVRSAMCDLARALLESRFATRPATHSGDSPHRIMVPAWLAYAQDRGHSRPAAEWAIYRLAETGRITLDEPGLYRIYRVRPLPEYASRALEDWASRLRGGRPARVTDWDLFDRPAILRITSEPTLWTWYAAETQQSAGGKPPADPFADLRNYARTKLKGQERAVVEALCDAGGELPLADVKTLCDWQDPIESAWNSLRMRLNHKLESHGWKLKTQGRTARLTKLDPE